MKKTITIEGVGILNAKPDLMTITMYIDKVDDTLEEALGFLDEEMERIESIFKEAGLNPTFIETSPIDIDIDPYFDNEGLLEYFEEMEVESDYDAVQLLSNMDEEDFTNSLPRYSVRKKLTFTDAIDYVKLHNIIDELEEYDSDLLEFEYTISDIDQWIKDALVSAVNDANDKARLIADTSGIQLDDIINIEYFSDDPLDDMDIYYSDNLDMSIDVTQKVTVTWEIK